MTGSPDRTEIDLAVPLIVGFGVTGQAVARVLVGRGHAPVVVDDRPSPQARTAADELGVRLVAAPDQAQLHELVDAASVVLPSPGVPDHHEVFALAEAAGRPVRSEFDLAQQWDDRPIVAITGTNGKTSVTMMVTAALEASGRTAVAVGNTPTPLIAAIDDPTIEVFVVEASSFRLGHSHCFRPTVATWMNFAPDHLDAHADLDAYRSAKASIWAHLDEWTIAIGNAEDATVMDALPGSGTTATFGIDAGDFRVLDGDLVGPEGPIIAVADLARRRPHDISNAACVAATALAAGATLDGVAKVLASFDGLPHRVAEVGSWNGISWFNDSKATVPQATLAAVSGFDSVVLIAGGKNKGLDLGVLRTAVPPVHTVVAIGEAAGDVSAVFADTEATVVTADSMAAAIERAADAAEEGDAVVLSPACASFDWYDNYGQRGDDFAARVTARHQGSSS